MDVPGARRETFEVAAAAPDLEMAEKAAKYEVLFDSIDEGFCIIQLVFNEGWRTGRLHLSGNQSSFPSANRIGARNGA